MESQPLISKNFSYAYNVLENVFPYLEIPDLVSCSQVCMSWRDVILRNPMWSRLVVKCCAKHMSTGCLTKELLLLAQKLDIEIDHSVEQKPCQVLEFADKVSELKLLSLTKCNCNISFSLGFSESLTTLSVVLCSEIDINDFQSLRHLTDLYVDADYSRGFFEPTHHFLKNLTSFGVGFSSYQYKEDVVSLFCTKLSELFIGVLSNISKLKLSGLITDFLILSAVSKHPTIKHLDMNLSASWNQYSAFLAKCNNIKKLSITLTAKVSSLTPNYIAAVNTILVQTVKELADNLEELCWNFDTTYLSESERAVAIYGSKSGCTAIFQPASSNLHMWNVEKLKKTIWGLDATSVTLSELKEVVQKEMPSCNVYVGTNKDEKRCIFCPNIKKDTRIFCIVRKSKLEARLREMYLQGQMAVREAR